MPKQPKPATMFEGVQREWPQQPLLDRLYACRFLLLLHDCISEGEDEKIRRRIAKLSDRLNGRRKPRTTKRK